MARNGRGSGDRIYELPSGLIHLADSLADAPHGKFVDRFGAPGDPTAKPSVERLREPGVQPALLKSIAGQKRKKFD